MTSFLGKIVASAIRIYTFPYRRKQKSLSANVKLKSTPYIPPCGTEFTTEIYDGTKVEKLSGKFAKDRIIVHFHGGGAAMGMNDLYRKTAERFFFGYIAGKIRIGAFVDDADIRPAFLKFFRNTFSNTVGTACDGNNFVMKHDDRASFFRFV